MVGSNRAEWNWQSLCSNYTHRKLNGLGTFMSMQTIHSLIYIRDESIKSFSLTES